MDLFGRPGTDTWWLPSPCPLQYGLSFAAFVKYDANLICVTFFNLFFQIAIFSQINSSNLLSYVAHGR